MSGQRGLVPSNFVEKVADESEMNMMMNGTGDGIGKMVVTLLLREPSSKLQKFPVFINLID